MTFSASKLSSFPSFRRIFGAMTMARFPGVSDERISNVWEKSCDVALIISFCDTEVNFVCPCESYVHSCSLCSPSPPLTSRGEAIALECDNSRLAIATSLQLISLSLPGHLD